MEILALFIAVAAFVALMGKEIKPTYSAADDFEKGLKAIAKEIKNDLTGGTKKSPPPDPTWSPWFMMSFAVMIGIFVTFIL
jgi:hypothetical protein